MASCSADVDLIKKKSLHNVCNPLPVCDFACFNRVKPAKKLTTDYFRGVASTKINESRKFSYESPTQLQYPYRHNPDITIGIVWTENIGLGCSLLAFNYKQH
jgi:hypothetical protein